MPTKSKITDSSPKRSALSCGGIVTGAQAGVVQKYTLATPHGDRQFPTRVTSARIDSLPHVIAGTEIAIRSGIPTSISLASISEVGEKAKAGKILDVGYIHSLVDPLHILICFSAGSSGERQAHWTCSVRLTEPTTLASGARIKITSGVIMGMSQAKWEIA